MKHAYAHTPRQTNIRSWLSMTIALAVTALMSIVLLSPNASALSVGVEAELDVKAGASLAADPIITCGPSKPDKDGSAWGKYFKGNGINIRRAPSTNSTICGQGQKSHRVDYHCWTRGSDGYTWTYLRDVTTKRAGWVRDNLLTNYGSSVHC